MNETQEQKSTPQGNSAAEQSAIDAQNNYNDGLIADAEYRQAVQEYEQRNGDYEEVIVTAERQAFKDYADNQLAGRVAANAAVAQREQRFSQRLSKQRQEQMELFRERDRYIQANRIRGRNETDRLFTQSFGTDFSSEILAQNAYIELRAPEIAAFEAQYGSRNDLGDVLGDLQSIGATVVGGAIQAGRNTISDLATFSSFTPGGFVADMFVESMYGQNQASLVETGVNDLVTSNISNPRMLGGYRNEKLGTAFELAGLAGGPGIVEGGVALARVSARGLAKTADFFADRVFVGSKGTFGQANQVGSIHVGVNKLSGADISLNVRGRIDVLKNDRFKFEFSNAEVDDILSNGRRLGFSDKDISDAMFTASRVDKRVGAQELIRRLDNHVNIVQKRGYPFGFDSLEQFSSYKQGIIKGLERYNIPVSDVRIHGSSVLKETPDDFDIAIIVKDDTFNSLTQRFAAGSSIPKMATQVMKEANKGKIPSRLFAPVQNPTVLRGIYEEGLSPLKSQVTLIRQGSQFDLGPYLNF